MKNEAVKIVGREVTLTVFYSIANIESDSNTFREIVGGRYDTTEKQAIEAVVLAAKAFASNLRAEGRGRICVWDDVGNSY